MKRTKTNAAPIINELKVDTTEVNGTMDASTRLGWKG